MYSIVLGEGSVGQRGRVGEGYVMGTHAFLLEISTCSDEMSIIPIFGDRLNIMNT